MLTRVSTRFTRCLHVSRAFTRNLERHARRTRQMRVIRVLGVLHAPIGRVSRACWWNSSHLSSKNLLRRIGTRDVRVSPFLFSSGGPSYIIERVYGR